MLNYADKDIIQRKRVVGVLGFFGIPKKYRSKAINIMVEKKLLEKVNRDKIHIINVNNVNDLPKNYYDLLLTKEVLEKIWRFVLLGK